jgi:hypothetical protein
MYHTSTNYFSRSVCCNTWQPQVSNSQVQGNHRHRCRDHSTSCQLGLCHHLHGVELAAPVGA